MKPGATLLACVLSAALIGCDQLPPATMSDMTPEEQATVREISRVTEREYRDNGYLNEAMRQYSHPDQGNVTAWARSRLVNLGAPIQAPELFAWALPSGTPEQLTSRCLNSGCSKVLNLPTLSVRVSGRMTVIAGARLKNRNDP